MRKYKRCIHFVHHIGLVNVQMYIENTSENAKHRKSTFTCVLTNKPYKVVAAINYHLAMSTLCPSSGESHDAQAWAISTVPSSA
jgi:hypothetical protein